jgi:hypothetical protein
MGVHGVLKIVVIQYDCMLLQWLGNNQPALIAYVTYVFRKSKFLSFIKNRIVFKEMFELSICPQGFSNLFHC